MNNLSKYIKESLFGRRSHASGSTDDLSEVTSWISQLRDINELISSLNQVTDELRGDDNDDHTQRYVSMIMQKLMNDPEIGRWFDSPYSSEYELKRILSKKLNTREIQYMDKIVDYLGQMSKNDNDPEIVNNIIMRIIDDPELTEWFDQNSVSGDSRSEHATNEFKVRAIIKKKLKGREKKFFEPICRKIMRIANNDHLGDDYFGNKR